MGLLKKLFGVSRNAVTHEQSFTIQKVNDLTISVDIADVEIIVHKLPKVDVKFVSFEGGPGLEITETDNDLTIISKKEHKGPTFFLGDIPKCYLKIFVPVDIANNWDVMTTSGVIKASHLVAVSFKMNATSGKVSLSNVTSEKMNISTTSGKIQLKELKMDSLTFHANSGTVGIHSFHGDISGHVGSGSVQISGAKGENLEVKAGSGKVVLNEVYMKNANLRANSGKIEAENFLVETTNAHVGSGKINIRNVRGNIKGSANSGNINLLISDNSSMDLKTGSGNIHIDFQEFELNANFDIKTGSGGIVTNLPMHVEERENHHLLGKAGDGEHFIRLRTGSGRAVLQTSRSSLTKQGIGKK